MNFRGRYYDGKAIIYLTTMFNLARETLFIKTGTDKNYVLTFSNPDMKKRILDSILKLNNEIVVIRES